jgi:peroxiredoxin
MSLSIGDPVPTFTLPDARGGEAGLGGGAPAVVVFTCNHCPYALAWHDRIVDVARDVEIPVLLVNPNDAERYPRDSFEAMRRRVEQDGGWPLPYLRDEDQSVAAAFGARTTPDVFVVARDGTLAYRGAPDADYQDPAQGAAWLRGAVDAVLADRRPDPAATEPVGCSVKWKASRH